MVIVWQHCCYLAVAVLAWTLPCAAFTKAAEREASRLVWEPFPVDGWFLQKVGATPGNVLGLLYSPTCPDCQWLLEKVWKEVAARLESDTTISVLTLADPQFLAPKPYEHWHNPAIFFAGAATKAYPIFFPQERLQEYLGGVPSRPQPQQDEDFVEDLLVFAKGATGVLLPTPPPFGRPLAPPGPLRDVELTAVKAWDALQHRWKVGAAGSTPPTAVQQQVQAPATPALRPAKASLIASKAQLQQQHDLRARQLAAAYEEQFMRAHPKQGYKPETVFSYALQYYRAH
eukprot:gnl/TRDRNA2_/TRDRNA2_179877_c0_seq1.p1 gnl/TRDRNA2_/TRDRNA2_179877_c0~~gnl/TRDRNA2_/TRDRNA2_179877_c0_seq1.p1  ORF type:complete len:287 (+),score=47.86 gnl/TRDRNA2_/TRDRNA2_179877_c0_seq1:84-944(+)